MRRSIVVTVCSLVSLLPLCVGAAGRAQTPPAPAASPGKSATTRARASTRTLPATILAVDTAAGTMRLIFDGGTVTARIMDDSQFFKKGKAARVQDFAANEKVIARL